MLTTQVASGGAGFNPGILREDRKIAMDQQQVRMFQTRVDQLGFWQMGRDTEPGGNDGAQRIIEGVKDGKYHFVDRWNPKTGAIRVSGLTLVMDLAQMNFPAEEVH